MGGVIEDWNLMENRIQDRKLVIFKPTLRLSSLGTRWNIVDITFVEWRRNNDIFSNAGSGGLGTELLQLS